MWFGKDYGRTPALWAGKSLSVQNLGNYAGNLNPESKADSRGLTCEVSEGNKDPIGAIYVIFRIKNYLSETLTLLGKLAPVSWG